MANLYQRDRDLSCLKIAGFGACMITGYPHKDLGFFEFACRLIEERLLRPVQSRIVSLGGFPAPRAEKYLKKRVFDFNPHYIVIQYGATDAQCPIRQTSRPTDHSRAEPILLSAHARHHKKSAPSDLKRFLSTRLNQIGRTTHDTPYSIRSAVQWELASAIGFLRRIEPITPLSEYICAMRRMVEDCISADITPVVLSPFVYGSRYTMKQAVLYADALQELCSTVRGALFINCVHALEALPRSSTLMNDGFHLSAKAHELIGELIGQTIAADLTSSGQGERQTVHGALTRSGLLSGDMEGAGAQM